jgi:hypothetical protein
MSLDTLTFNNVDYVVYVSDVEADAYLNVDPRYQPKWNAIAATDRIRCIISATRALDRYRWAGSKADDAQENAFPRVGLVDAEGLPVIDDNVPPDIEDACCILAGELAIDPGVLTSESGKVGSVSVSGALSVTYRGPLPDAKSSGISTVDALIAPYLAGNSVAGAAYGTGGSDAFANSPAGLGEGFN